MYEREILAAYHDLFIVHGSPTNLPDLVRAGLETASVMACHANPAHGTKFSGAGDAQVVMTTLIVESIYPGLRVVSELNRPKFVKHLGVTGDRPKSTLPEWLFMFEMVYAAGDVINSSFLEALLCQAFFNSSIISIVDALLDHTDVGEETRPVSQAGSSLLSPAHSMGVNGRAQGHVQSRHMFGRRRVGDFTPLDDLDNHANSKATATPSSAGLRKGHLFQVDMPDGFAVRVALWCSMCVRVCVCVCVCVFLPHAPRCVVSSFLSSQHGGTSRRPTLPHRYVGLCGGLSVGHTGQDLLGFV